MAVRSPGRTRQAVSHRRRARGASGRILGISRRLPIHSWPKDEGGACVLVGTKGGAAGQRQVEGCLAGHPHGGRPWLLRRVDQGRVGVWNHHGHRQGCRGQACRKHLTPHEQRHRLHRPHPRRPLQPHRNWKFVTSGWAGRRSRASFDPRCGRPCEAPCLKSRHFPYCERSWPDPRDTQRRPARPPCQQRPNLPCVPWPREGGRAHHLNRRHRRTPTLAPARHRSGGAIQRTQVAIIIIVIIIIVCEGCQRR
mmetsp:Transcript_25733/g.49905  ORF Transcript_25733/g.49905 Transcript_25733/m.49905 type:complete len:252 (-) Transcript_25733:755-1510(-)